MAAPPSPAKPQTPPVPAIVLIVPVVAVTLRTTQLALSAMKTLPAPSTATPVGELSSAAVAGPPSPAKSQKPPVPATVLIVPVVATLRMTQFPLSAMKRLPTPSRATPAGWLSSATVAGPPSPVKSNIPAIPATVLIAPVVPSTLRTTELSWSAMKRSPAASRATPVG